MAKRILNSMLGVFSQLVIVITIGMLVFAPATSWATLNTAVGDIAGVDGDLGDGTFNLNTVALGVVKTAFLTDGTQLTDNDNLPKGTVVQFLIYIDNTTAVGVNDVSIRDALTNPPFAYNTGTMQVTNAPASGSTAAAIRTAALAGAAVSDGDSDDIGRFGADTIDIGDANIGTNTQLNINANAVWALIFEVTMQ